MTAWSGEYVQEIVAASSRTVTILLIYIATTKCSWAFCRTNPVNMMYRDNNDHFVLGLTIMQRQQLMTLCWRLFCWWGKVHLTSSVCYQGGQYFVSHSLHTVATGTSKDTRIIIIDAPATLTPMIVLRGKRILVYIYSQPEISVWLMSIYQASDCPICKTENNWRSIDAHFKVLYCHFLQQSMIVEVIIWCVSLRFCPIRNQPVGKAKPRKIPAQASLILPKLLPLFQ